MNPNTDWTDVQRRAGVPGSPILTNWRAERQAARAGTVRNEATVTYDQSVLEAFGVIPGAAGITVTPVSAMRVAAVFACVQKIAGAISTLPLDVFKTDGETPVKLPRDDLLLVLEDLVLEVEERERERRSCNLYSTVCLCYSPAPF